MDHGLDARALLIPAREQPRARGRADVARGMEIRESHALGGEAVNLGRLEVGIAEAAHAGMAHVVDHDDDDVRLRRGGGRAGHGEAVQTAEQEECEEAFHESRGVHRPSSDR